MRFPRIRWTVRRLMLLVVACAVVLALVEEFGAGDPSRFVLRSIPGRIARLRVGMNRAEVHHILGMDRPWWQGWIGILEGLGRGDGHVTCYTSHIWGTPPSRKGFEWGNPVFSRPHQNLRLCFREEDDWYDWQRARDSGTLLWADFDVDGRTIAEMPPRIHR